MYIFIFIFEWTYELLRRHLDPTTYGDYPQSMKDAVGARLPKFTKAQKAKLKGSADFVGINYYSSFYAKASEKPDYRQPSWATDSLVEFERKIHHIYIRSRILVNRLLFCAVFKKKNCYFVLYTINVLIFTYV